jgi:hypothetical protein
MFIYVMVRESWKVAKAGKASCTAVGTVVDAGVVLRLGAVVPADWNTRRRLLVRQQQGPQHTCTLGVCLPAKRFILAKHVLPYKTQMMMPPSPAGKLNLAFINRP